MTNHFIMRKLGYYILVFPLLLTACTDEFLIERKEDRIIGAWEFEEAFFKEDGDIFRDNVFNDFRNDIVEFFPNYTATYDDASLRSIFDGDWVLYLERELYDDDDDKDFFLNMTFYDFINREDFSYFTSVVWVSSNRMTLIAHTRSGFYKFKMRRIN
jgi:hypothetical protein